MLLFVKLVLVPILIAVVTLASRKWGARGGGFLAALPIVAGPTLCFFAIDRGGVFAADAAQSTLLGLVAVAAFCAAYFFTSVRLHWAPSLIIGWSAFGLVTYFLFRVQAGLLVSFIAAIAALLVVRKIIPSPTITVTSFKSPSWDIPARMVAAGGLVTSVTLLAERLGPNLSGLLTPFPVAIAILAAFTHSQMGWQAVAIFFRSFLPGLCSFALFCLIFSLSISSHGLVFTVAVSLIAQLILQGAILWGMKNWKK